MAKKKPAKKNRTINQRFTALERLVRFEFRGLRKEMNERFAVMEDRIDRLATHVDGFMKLQRDPGYRSEGHERTDEPFWGAPGTY